MKLEDQVCSLELAKRLKELGAKQDGYFSWVYHWSDAEDGSVWEVFGSLRPSGDDDASAYTVAELGEMLPKEINTGSIGTFKCIDGYKKGKWFCAPIDPDEECGAKDWGDPAFYADTEADARAKMVVYLKENNLL